MRDSQSLLEQLLAFGGARITLADVHRMLGTAAEGRLVPLVQRLAARDAAGALQQLSEALAEGVDVGQLLEQLLGYFRDLMVAAVGLPRRCVAVCACPPSGPKSERQLEQLGVNMVLAIMQILDQTWPACAIARMAARWPSWPWCGFAAWPISTGCRLLIEQVAAGGPVQPCQPSAAVAQPAAASNRPAPAAAAMSSRSQKKKMNLPAAESPAATLLRRVGTASLG